MARCSSVVFRRRARTPTSYPICRASISDEPLLCAHNALSLILILLLSLPDAVGARSVAPVLARVGGGQGYGGGGGGGGSGGGGDGGAIIYLIFSSCVF